MLSLWPIDAYRQRFPVPISTHSELMSYVALQSSSSSHTG